MKKPTAQISTRGNYLYSNGYQMAHIRLYIGRKSNFYAIPNTYFKPENWDKNKREVKNKTPDCTNINLYIQDYLLKSRRILQRYDMENRNITFSSFEKELYGKGYDTDFFEYANQFASKYENGATKDKYLDTISKFKDYNRSENLSFSEIDETLLRKFKSWCMNERNNKEITADRGLGQIRTIFNAAIKEGLIKENPVRSIKFRSHAGKQNTITAEAVKFLIEYWKKEKLKKSTKNSLSAFLFACCCGLRWSDIQKMKFKDLKGNILEVTERKTKKFRRINIMPSALLFIDFSNKISDEQNIFTLCKTSSPTNITLKSIANIINEREDKEIVSKTISFHSSRATFEAVAEHHSDLYTSALMTGNSPEIAAKNYVPENREKMQTTLNAIEDAYFRE